MGQTGPMSWSAEAREQNYKEEGGLGWELERGRCKEWAVTGGVSACSARETYQTMECGEKFMSLGIFFLM